MEPYNKDSLLPRDRHSWEPAFEIFLTDLKGYYDSCSSSDGTASMAKLLVAETILMCMRNRWALAQESPLDMGRTVQPGSPLSNATLKAKVEEDVNTARQDDTRGYAIFESAINTGIVYYDRSMRPSFFNIFGRDSEKANKRLAHEEKILRRVLMAQFADQQSTPYYSSWLAFVKIFEYASQDREMVRQYRVGGNLLNNINLKGLVDLHTSLQNLEDNCPLKNKAMKELLDGKIIRNINDQFISAYTVTETD